MTKKQQSALVCLRSLKVLLLLSLCVAIVPRLTLEANDAYAKPRLAVFEFETKNMDKGTVEAVTEFVQSQLEHSGLYTMIERYQLERILKEQVFQYQGLVDETTAVAIGKMTGASKLVLGSMNRMGDDVVINVRIVNAETGEIEGSASESGRAGRIRESALRLVRALTTGDRSEYQAYMRSQTYGNSLRIEVGHFLFTEYIKIDNWARNYRVSLRKKGIPFLKTYNWHTEIELGYFKAGGTATWAWNPITFVQKQILDHVECFPCTLSAQYYVPVSFVTDIYVKAGAGAAYLQRSVTAEYSGMPAIPSTIVPLGKIGIGFDLSKASRMGFHIELMHNEYFADGLNPTGQTFNAGISYNW